MMSPKIKIDRAKVETFCRKWKITELSLFGSVLRDDFREDSDVDVLVKFAEDTKYSLFDVIRAENELAVVIGRHVDLIEREAVEESDNWIRRRHILKNVEPFYVAGCVGGS